jgi:hypothetical protein
VRFSVWEAPAEDYQSEVQDNKTGKTIVRAMHADALLVSETLNLEGLTQVFGEVSVSSAAAKSLQLTACRFQWQTDVVIYGPDWIPERVHRGVPG